MGRIPLCDRTGMPRAWAIVDDDIHESIDAWRWHLTTRGYATRTKRPFGAGGPSRGVLMHREIMGLTCGDGLQVDHINRNKLDNRRANLRIVDGSAANNQNTPGGHGKSGIRGVHWRADRNRWIVRVVRDRRMHLGGSYTDLSEAARAAAQLRLQVLPYAID